MPPRRCAAQHTAVCVFCDRCRSCSHAKTCGRSKGNRYLDLQMFIGSVFSGGSLQPESAVTAGPSPENVCAVLTQAIYAWWQYELCDVFIELTKPVLSDAASEPALVQATRDTLWVCLDTGLRCAAMRRHSVDPQQMAASAHAGSSLMVPGLFASCWRQVPVLPCLGRAAAEVICCHEQHSPSRDASSRRCLQQ